MSEYNVKYTRHEYIEVEVIVEGAATEEDAQRVADEYVNLGEGKYRYDRNPGVYVTINETVEDSDLELDDGSEPEWTPDEEDEEAEMLEDWAAWRNANIPGGE